jgi:hypothetical protein
MSNYGLMQINTLNNHTHYIEPPRINWRMDETPVGKQLSLFEPDHGLVYTELGSKSPQYVNAREYALRDNTM